MELFRDIEIIRIPLAKYQIAKDKKLRVPLQFAQDGDDEVPAKIMEYDKGDQQRNHVMPRGFSARGSMQWCAIDVEGENYRKWLERRELSDRFLHYLRTLPKA